MQKFPSLCFPFVISCVFALWLSLDWQLQTCAVLWLSRASISPEPVVLTFCSRQAAVWKVSRSLAGVGVRSAVGLSWVDARHARVRPRVQAHARAKVVLHWFVAKRLPSNAIKWLLPLSWCCSYVWMHLNVYLFIYFARNVNLSRAERCPHKLIQPSNLSHLQI